MDVFLAAYVTANGYVPGITKGCKCLESFYTYERKWDDELIYLKDFILDSGAFSYMTGVAKAVDWEEYIKKYAEFIKERKIKKYFELDIDSIVGYEEVCRLRTMLEKMVGWQCIPVFHKSRGIEEFKRMCEEYKYIAIGGIVTKEWTKKEYPYFEKLLKYAHSKGVKVHGLGFTSLKGLKKYHFDSVDSTSWLAGVKYRTIYKFRNGDLMTYSIPKGKRYKYYKDIGSHNFSEWKKFSEWAEQHL